MFENWEALRTTVLEALPNVAAALGILVVGWLIATLVAAGVRRGLARTRFDERIAGWLGDRDARTLDVGRVAARVVFIVLMLMVTIAVFQALQLTIVTEPVNALLSELFEFAPRLLGAAALILLAWVLATVVKKLVIAALNLRAAPVLSDDLDESGRQGLSAAVGEASYWLVFLLFLPAVLGTLELTGLLQPVQSMLDRAMAFLPNLLAAGLILLVGSFVAKIVRRLATSLLVAVGADRLGAKIGLSAEDPARRLSGVVGIIAHVLVLFPVLIAALDALALEAITAPASAMLGTLLDAVPAIFAATVVVLLAVAIGRVIGGLVGSLLQAAGFDGLVARTGLLRGDAAARHVASTTAARVVQLGIVLFAAIEAASLLGFATLADLVAQFLVFGGDLLLGLAIFGLGLALANAARGAITGSGTASASLLGRSAWIAIVTLTGAMALRRMGIANEIIELAFALLLGAAAVAAALAFGLGGRDAAGRQVAAWMDRTR